MKSKVHNQDENIKGEESEKEGHDHDSKEGGVIRMTVNQEGMMLLCFHLQGRFGLEDLLH